MTVAASGVVEDAVDAGGAPGGAGGGEHHAGPASVALVGAADLEVEEGLLLGRVEPVVTWDPGVGFVDRAVAVLPEGPIAIPAIPKGVDLPRGIP